LAEVIHLGEYGGASPDCLRAIATAKNLLRNEDIRGLAMVFLLPNGDVGTLIHQPNEMFHQMHSGINTLRVRFERENIE
jgi:hypothetical protein